MRLRARQAWGRTLALPLVSGVSLGGLVNISNPLEAQLIILLWKTAVRFREDVFKVGSQ